MEFRDYSPAKKALQINLDDSIYGTFAEIGAGQEVARHFFQAGRASHTIAKSISAYDMTFSDEIYGKDSRYVCESRLIKMLDREFGLLEQRLHHQRGEATRFFALANTVATNTQEGSHGKSHGWMGIRFQTRPQGPANDIILHLRLWDRFRLPQQEALGILGVNLVHMAYFPERDAVGRITQLIDSLSTKRIEVNMIRFRGPDLIHLNNRLLSLELVKQGLTDAVLFAASGEVLNAGDALFNKAILLQRSTYRPVTNANMEIVDRALAKFKSSPLMTTNHPNPDLAAPQEAAPEGTPASTQAGSHAEAPVQDVDIKVLLEVTMDSLASEDGLVNDEDFLHRVDLLGAVGAEVLVSKFRLFYEMKSYLRQFTQKSVALVIGASLLPRMFDETFYRELPGGILEGMSRLFDDNTRIFVSPMKQRRGVGAGEGRGTGTAATGAGAAKEKSGGDMLMAGRFSPIAKLDHLYKHLLVNGLIADLDNCGDVDTSVHSSDVRAMLEARDPRWKSLVPERARRLIEERQLFGYH